MHKTLLICLSAFMLAAAPEQPFDAASNDTAENESRIIAFVGEQIFTREALKRDSKDDSGRLIIRMDNEWQARYRVLERLSGTYDAPTIDFTAYDHYGKPRFSDTDGAVLLYVHDRKSGRIHDKYNFKRVYQTKDGDWATCGSPFEEDFEAKRYPYNIEGSEVPPPLVPMDFKTSVQFDISGYYRTFDPDPDETLTEAERLEMQAEIEADNREIDAEFVSPVYARNGNQVTCLMGILAADVVRHELATSFRHRKVEDHCEATHAHQKPDGHRGTGVETYEAYKLRQQPYKDAVKQCFNRLYPSGWPYTD